MGQVRVAILAPSGEVVERRTYEDDWYATGDGRPRWAQQRTRAESAAGELREWLVLNPASGRYTISVSEVSNGNGAGRLWVSVNVMHHKRPRSLG